MSLYSLLLLCFISSAHAFVQVNPVRLHVKASKLGHFTVRNTQSKPVSVEIENKYFSLQPDGQMKPGKGDDELKKILFTPKNFQLGPGEKQVVRFFVKDEAPKTELRTFAYILTEVKNDQNESGSSNSPAQVLTLTPKVAVAIPVIYRLITDKNNTQISDERFEQKGENCWLFAKWRNSTHSSYINLELFDAKDKIIATLNGASNYLKEYDWKHEIDKTKCTDIKKMQVRDVDNDALVVNREVK